MSSEAKTIMIIDHAHLVPRNSLIIINHSPRCSDNFNYSPCVAETVQENELRTKEKVHYFDLQDNDMSASRASTKMSSKGEMERRKKIRLTIKHQGACMNGP